MTHLEWLVREGRCVPHRLKGIVGFQLGRDMGGAGLDVLPVAEVA